MDPRLRQAREVCIQAQTQIQTWLATAQQTTAIPVAASHAWTTFNTLLMTTLSTADQTNALMTGSAGKDPRVLRVLATTIRGLIAQADTLAPQMATVWKPQNTSFDVTVLNRLLTGLLTVYPDLADVDPNLPMESMTPTQDLYLTPLGNLAKMGEQEIRSVLSLLNRRIAEVFTSTIGESQAMLSAGMLDRSQLRRSVQNYKHGLATYRDQLNVLGQVFLQAEPPNSDISSFCWVGVRQLYINQLNHLLMYDKQAMDLLGDR